MNRNLKICEKCLYYTYFLEQGVKHKKESYKCGMDDWLKDYVDKDKNGNMVHSSSDGSKAWHDRYINLKPTDGCPYKLEHLVLEQKNEKSN